VHIYDDYDDDDDDDEMMMMMMMMMVVVLVLFFYCRTSFVAVVVVVVFCQSGVVWLFVCACWGYFLLELLGLLVNCWGIIIFISHVHVYA